MASRPLVLRTQRAYICPSCHNHQRHLTTTARLSAISPESPRYIDIPTPPQQTSTPTKRIKGVLPVPRDVMARRTPASISASIRDRTTPHEPTSPKERFEAHMTSLRKTNLRTAAEALHVRRTAAEKETQQRSRASRRERDAALLAPEHFADRLTAPTLDASVAAELARYERKAALPDPAREKRLVKARKRVARTEEGLKARRADALHTLYMNARTFVVDEQGLNRAIDEAFGTVDEPHNFGGDMPSLWSKGAPPKINEMALGMAGLGRSALQRDVELGQMEVLKDRVRRMAEGVTGGKMDP
ncbi:hypothetical protein ANO11243_064860 [Dothideomycetidae sp. 11243]|nr:hypothetical protein ANO11243_064860 [fungal sp. No.11243]